MSKYKKYAVLADTMAKEYFRKYGEAEAALRECERRARQFPATNFVDNDYRLKSARAQIALIEAKDEYKAAKADFTNSIKEFDKLRDSLAEEVEREYNADPSELDNSTIELLKSGIMRADEYKSLYERAKAEGNSTMCRIIGRYAHDYGEEREKKYGARDAEALAMRLLVHQSKEETGADILEAFDSICGVYQRCTNNAGLISHWDSLVSDMVENF